MISRRGYFYYFRQNKLFTITNAAQTNDIKGKGYQSNPSFA